MFYYFNRVLFDGFNSEAANQRCCPCGREICCYKINTSSLVSGYDYSVLAEQMHKLYGLKILNWTQFSFHKVNYDNPNPSLTPRAFDTATHSDYREQVRQNVMLWLVWQARAVGCVLWMPKHFIANCYLPSQCLKDKTLYTLSNFITMWTK